jgi:hypothetical protein
MSSTTQIDRRWSYRGWATLDDPAHKSDLNQITGDYGCLKSFRYAKDARAQGRSRESEHTVGGRLVAGTAVHETIARALSNEELLPQLLSGEHRISRNLAEMVLREELERAVAGREIIWHGKDSGDDIFLDRLEMVLGVLNDLHEHVAEVIAIEPGFIVQLGGYWLSGHLDLVYRPKALPGAIAFADWKTGATKPTGIELDHSWESGIYSLALQSGIWIGREHFELPKGTPNRYMREREALEAELIRVAKLEGPLPAHARRYGAFPEDIRHVHLPDYVPYEKAGKKAVKRPEELAFWKLEQSAEVKYVKGMRRGPAWYQVRRSEQDIPRLEHLLKNVVGTVRLGRFFESVGEKCERCTWKQDCLTTGYELRGDEAKQLEMSIRGLDLADDGLGN